MTVLIVDHTAATIAVVSDVLASALRSILFTSEVTTALRLAASCDLDVAIINESVAADPQTLWPRHNRGGRVTTFVLTDDLKPPSAIAASIGPPRIARRELFHSLRHVYGAIGSSMPSTPAPA